MHINELVKQLPKETKTKVEQAKNAYNRIIREAIRFESRLSLNSGKSDDINEDNSSIKIPIKVEVGYPEEIANFIIPEQYAFAAILSQIRNELIRLKESAGIVSSFICAHQHRDEMFEFAGGAICYSEIEADKLLQIIDQYDLVKELLSFNKDILGCYRYSIDLSQFKNLTPANREIFLYWGVIGLMAPRLGVTIEALTAVTLAHELAHAYTHLGYDIDGNRWSDNGFQDSDLEVTEGLAQYYTERVVSRLILKIPGGWDAYTKLLEKQSSYYQAHKRWINEFKATPENVRETLIQARSLQRVLSNQFNDMLHQNNARRYR